MKKPPPKSKQAAAGGQEALIRLARELSKDPGLPEDIRLAFSDPDAYIAKHLKRLRLRGIGARQKVEGLPWIALIDGLIAEGHGTEIDGRSDADEIEAELSKLEPAPPADVWSKLPKAAREASARDVLGAVANALAGSPQALVEIVRPTDTYAVLLVPRKSLARLGELAAEAGGSIRELSQAAASSHKPPASAPRGGSWKGILFELGVRDTNALLGNVGFEPELRQRAKQALPSAPKKDAALIGTVLSLLDGERFVPTADADTDLEAIRYLAVSPDHGGRALQLLDDVIGARGLVPRKGAASTRAVVKAVRMAPEIGRRAFAALPPEAQQRLRAFAHAQLASTDATALVEALNAARVVGDEETLALVRPLMKSSSPLAAQHAKAAAAFLGKASKS